MGFLILFKGNIKATRPGVTGAITGAIPRHQGRRDRWDRSSLVEVDLVTWLLDTEQVDPADWSSIGHGINKTYCLMVWRTRWLQDEAVAFAFAFDMSRKCDCMREVNRREVDCRFVPQVHQSEDHT